MLKRATIELARVLLFIQFNENVLDNKLFGFLFTHKNVWHIVLSHFIAEVRHGVGLQQENI